MTTALCIVDAGLLIASPGILVLFVLQEQRIRDKLRLQGIAVQATITERDHELDTKRNADGTTSRTGHGRYHITYHYTVDGTVYRRRQRVSPEIYEALTQNTLVEVVYLPDKPNEVRLASDVY